MVTGSELACAAFELLLQVPFLDHLGLVVIIEERHGSQPLIDTVA